MKNTGSARRRPLLAFKVARLRITISMHFRERFLRRNKRRLPPHRVLKRVSAKSLRDLQKPDPRGLCPHPGYQSLQASSPRWHPRVLSKLLLATSTQPRQTKVLRVLGFNRQYHPHVVRQLMQFPITIYSHQNQQKRQILRHSCHPEIHPNFSTEKIRWIR